MRRRKKNLLFFHCALQRLLVRARKIHNLTDLCLRNFKGKDPANTNAAAMNGQHNICGFLTAFIEKPLQNMNDKFHRSIIIVQEQNLIHRRLFGFRPCFECDTGLRMTVIITVTKPGVMVVITMLRQAQPPRSSAPVYIFILCFALAHK